MSPDHDAVASEIHEHLNTYIKLADQKASILLTAQFAFLGLFANALRTLLPETGTLFHGVAILTALVGLIGIGFAGWVIYPRTDPPAEDGDGFIFWGDILEHGSATSYRDAFTQLDEDGLHAEVVRENYALADIAETKYTYLRWALRCTAAMLILAFAAGGLYII